MIITHDNIFHADEIFSIALLHRYAKVSIDNIIRTRDEKTIAEAQKLSHVYVVDVGLVYDDKNLNFDHHQDTNLPASNILILRHLKKSGLIKHDFYLALLPVMSFVSNHDLNKSGIVQSWNKYRKVFGWYNISNLISSYNRSIETEHLQKQQFMKAIGLALSILENIDFHTAAVLQSAEIISNGLLVSAQTTLFEQYPFDWKNKCKTPYAIFPTNTNWVIQTKDSIQNPLPVFNAPGLVFQHPNRFMAVFETQEAAIKASELIP